MIVRDRRRWVFMLGLSGLLAVAAVWAHQGPLWSHDNAPAAGRSWAVLDVVGTASHRQSDESPWVPLARNGGIGAGAQIRVGSGSELVIADAGDVVTIGERSYLQLPLDTTPDRSGLIQQRGRVHYEIESVPSRRFGVDTPYLTITVKGTAFIVDVDDREVDVGVERGRVEVDSPDGRYSIALNQGQRARKPVETDAPLEFLAHPGAAPEMVAALPAGSGNRHRASARTDFSSAADGAADVRHHDDPFIRRDEGKSEHDDRSSSLGGGDVATMALSAIAAALAVIFVATLFAAVATRLRTNDKRKHSAGRI